MMAVRAELPDGSIPLSEPTMSSTDHLDRSPRLDVPPVGLATFSTSATEAAVEARLVGEPTCPMWQATSHSRATAWLRLSVRQDRPIPLPRSECGHSHDPHALTTVEKETSESFLSTETFDPRLTRTGARLGTGAYMAPEQFRDPRSVDVRADIYAFGVVLFEMITGGLPFKGRSTRCLEPPAFPAQAPFDRPSVLHAMRSSPSASTRSSSAASRKTRPTGTIRSPSCAMH